MFTGIVQDIGEIREVIAGADTDARFVIGVDALDLSVTEIGASVACAGCCLTVVEKGADWFAVDVSAESLSKTTLKDWVKGVRVNLEPALKMGDELGGHMVSGHVDGLAEIVSVKEEGGSRRLKIKAPADLAAFIAPKGSVTLDGISLTVNDVEGAMFGVNIIPHTWAHTTLSGKSAGGHLNLEVDMLARYVARMMEARDAA